ncbi:MAG: methyltransferase domain-containing protein [Alphaproteobacteria bacterium]|nr:methyltransferase domain-containing protein [Alphaproteobacteria bacterium]
MYADVVDLREFYLSPLGQTVQRILQARLRHIWPSVRGETVLALGYGTPLLRPLLEEAGTLAALMPATQGVAYWPREGPNISCLVDTDSLPLPDQSVDRVILIHALEGAPDPNRMLQEIWRVMKSGGRMLLIVSNRRGLWAHSDRTPFGTGQPYSAFQIKDTLRDHGFLVDRSWRALYMPPSASRLNLSLADMLEKYGEKIFPGFGGLLLMEAGKQIYAPLLMKPKDYARRLIFPLPAPMPAGYTPFSKSS